MRRAPFVVALLAACSSEEPLPIHVYVDPSDAAMAETAEELASDLRAAGGRVEVRSGSAPACDEAAATIALGGPAAGMEPQSFEVEDQRCGDRGRVITTRGADRLASQWAAFAIAEGLGVRYFHPEQTFYPAAIRWPESLAQTARPAMARRSIHVHRTHPVELLPPLAPGDLDMAGYQRRWVRWNIALRQTQIDGWDFELLGAWPYDRGFGRGAGFNLLNSQQGGRPILDPDDPRPESEQLAEAIDDGMREVPGLPPVTSFGFQFNPSEFTEVDDQLTVERLTFISNYLSDNYPGVTQSTTNHGTAGAPTAHYGVRFYDLPQFAPPALGVSVHLLMFYGLDRPAPVYGNSSFEHSRRWIEEQSAVRRIVYYPEASWWLTFDLPVPLYLAPVTLEARQKDLEILRPRWARDPSADKGVIGHHIFSSGQEWGYWLIDYCVTKMTWDLDFTHRRCVEDFTAQLARGGEIAAVLAEVEARQVVDLRDPELIRYLVGSDDETEVAFEAGIDFHPLPAPPVEVLGWPEDRVAALETDTLPRLRAMAEDYRGWAARVDATLGEQDPRQAPWVREIRDGIAVFGLRAEHAAEVYATVLELRRALASRDLAAVNRASEGLDRARSITEAARQIVHARAEDYRYPPALTIAGDEPGESGAVENGTIYPYRYLSRTHRMFYWTRPDRQLAALFGEGLEQVQPSGRILLSGEPLHVALLAAGVEGLRIDYGDGTVSSTTSPHTYAAQGEYSWTVDAQLPQGILHHEDRAAVAAQRYIFPKRSLKVSFPEGAAAIEGLLPGLQVGLGDDGAPFWILGQITGAEPIAARGTLLRRGRSGLGSGPEDLRLDLRGVGPVTVLGAVLVIDDSGAQPVLIISGQLSTQEVIDLLVSVGGFEPQGARTLIAGILEFTPETLPERVAFELRARGTE